MPSRRMRGEGHIGPYRRGGEQIGWTGSIELPADPRTGKRRRRQVYGKTQKEVATKLAALRKELGLHGDLPTGDITLDKWLIYWLDEVAHQRLKPGSMRGYRSALTQYVIPSIGRKRLDRLSVADVRTMHRYVTDTKGLSTTTAHNAHRYLSVALNDAVREGVASRNIAALVPAPPKAPRRRKALTVDQAVTVMRTAADDRLGSRWMAALLLGARQGECLGLRWDHVDLTGGLVDVSWSLQRAGYEHGCGERTGEAWPCGKRTAKGCPVKRLAIPPGMEHETLVGAYVLLRPKSEASRRLVPLPLPLWEALKVRRVQADTEAPTYPFGFVWCRPDGRFIDPADDTHAWDALLRQAKVPDVTLHEARHTTATLLLEMKVPPTVIRDILGHSDVVTQEGYKHVSVALAREALDGLADRLALS